MGEFINKLGWTTPLYPDNVVSDVYRQYMPHFGITTSQEDDKWMREFAENECTGIICTTIDRGGSTCLSAEYPEDLALFVMRALIRKQSFG